MAPRYLSLSELEHVRRRAEENLRPRRSHHRRRPRRANRVRTYVSDPAGDLAPLALAVRRYLALGAA
ncbi:hypothetical protein GCM10007147_23000 [Nocardiopsis kunsanensis]|uniref:Uncharacterized protein n=1 Tax=Nocardiopsis kunsanensis TaxID=141693 RepID=A0A918XDB1_9ACTN|nr:hypothetical protein [Nocardiopsis kunsanensis]GHD25674.1 hypothetical protein GCM10007147_23000 [Nocardiopsis kunsanensis]